MADDKKARKAMAMQQVARVQPILRRWDPIGVQPGELAPADEYDSYAPHIVSLVIAHGCSVAQPGQHLEMLRTEAIGLEADHESDMDIAKEVIDALRENAP